MLTGELKNQIDRIWDAFWAGGIANPLGTIASVAMLLRHSLALEEEARAVEKAVDAAVTAGARTADMGGERPMSTRDMGSAVCERLG